MTNLLRDSNKKFEREDIFKPKIGNDSLHQDSNDNSVRITNNAASKNLVLGERYSRTEKFINTPGPILMGGLTTRLIIYR